MTKKENITEIFFRLNVLVEKGYISKDSSAEIMYKVKRMKYANDVKEVLDKLRTLEGKYNHDN